MKKLLDKRGVFLVVNKEKLFVWKGELVEEPEKFLSKAKEYVNYLQKYEKAPSEVVFVEDGSEPEEFYKVWFRDGEKPVLAEVNAEWDLWYEDLVEEESPVQIIKSKALKEFYRYPNEEAESLVDLDDLEEDVFFVGCHLDDEQSDYRVHVWKGSEVELTEKESDSYLEKVRQKVFGGRSVEVVVEEPNNETEQFYDLL